MKSPPRFVIEDDDIDLLRRFTAWIEHVVYYARLEYMRRFDHAANEISLEEAPESAFVYEDPPLITKNQFEFEDASLSRSFSRLSLLRRRILILIFVEGLSAQDTADALGCSVDYVYKQKHMALKKLRDQLMDGGDIRGK
jgi:RNA polymerase sigma factor (sigma-70 family)